MDGLGLNQVEFFGGQAAEQSFVLSISGARAESNALSQTKMLRQRDKQLLIRPPGAFSQQEHRPKSSQLHGNWCFDQVGFTWLHNAVLE